jgi:hypothetical protein
MRMRAWGLKAWISAAAFLESKYQTEASPPRQGKFMKECKLEDFLKVAMP